MFFFHGGVTGAGRSAASSVDECNALAADADEPAADADVKAWGSREKATGARCPATQGCERCSNSFAATDVVLANTSKESSASLWNLSMVAAAAGAVR